MSGKTAKKTNHARATLSGIEVWCRYDETPDITTLVENPRNPNRHPDKQIALLAKIIRHQGWRAPITVSKRSGYIVKGHGRLQAAKVLNVESVPVELQDYENEAAEMADLLADNRIAELAEPDQDGIQLLLNDAALFEGFDMDLTGFDESVRDEFKEPVEGLTDEDDVPEVPVEPDAKLGQIWTLGNHRLMCGDSTDAGQVARLMDGKKADMVFTDPPYGVSIVGRNGKVGGDNLAKNGVYAQVAGDDSTNIAVKAIELIAGLGASAVIIWGGNYYASHLPDSSCWIVWDKREEMAGNNFADCELAWTNQKTAVRKFSHTWSGMIKASEHGQKRVHPTQKPIALAEWCFDNYGKACSTVLDLFVGSGSTLIACETRQKSGFMMELSPAYCDVIIKRWENFTGKKAELITEEA